MDQANFVIQLGKCPSPMVSSASSLDRDRAGRLIRQERDQSLARQLLVQRHLSRSALTVQKENALRRVDTDVGKWFIAGPPSRKILGRSDLPATSAEEKAGGSIPSPMSTE
jgi:hypothetical protein